MREDRLKRMQAFQASSILREEPEEHGENDNLEEENTNTTETENPFYSSFNEALVNQEELEDPLKNEREKSRLKIEEDERELKKIEEENYKEELEASPHESLECDKNEEVDKYSGVGMIKSMIDNDKEKIQKELTEEENRLHRETHLDEERKIKNAEKLLKKSRRRGDPNNPSKEEMDAAQELEQLTWQDRYLKNKRVKDVVSSSKMFSKVKNKLKLEKSDKEIDTAVTTENVVETKSKSEGDSSPKTNSLPGMIGSLEEYASLVGKSVAKLADTKYEPPELESSDESEGDQEDGELWGAIMGGK